MKTINPRPILRRARPACGRCGCVNTVTASGWCVNCHAPNGGR